MDHPKRGDVWFANFDPTRGHEQSGNRPCLVVSVDAFNASAADLLIVVPITSQDKGIRSHVRIDPPEGGLKKVSYAKCEDIRSIARERLSKRWGRIHERTMSDVEIRLRILLGLTAS